MKICTKNPARRRSESGFTLIELMVVMLIIGVLMAIAVPNYVAAVKAAKESVLKEDLHVMRNAIDSYTMEKQKGPESLQDLVESGCLLYAEEINNPGSIHHKNANTAGAASIAASSDPAVQRKAILDGVIDFLV